MDALNFNHLYYFWRVCKAGSVSGASKQLRVSQSSISSQISQLEGHLGTKLLQRAGRQGVLPTEDGALAFKHAERVFAAGQELVDAVRDRTQRAQKRDIRIGATPGLSRGFQLSLLQDCLKDPDLTLSVSSAEMPTLLDRLLHHELDLVLSTQPALGNRFLAYTLLESPMMLVGVPSLGRSVRKAAHPELALPLFVPASDADVRGDFEIHCRQRRLNPSIKAEAEDISLLRFLSLSGRGLALVPEIGVQRELAEGALKIYRRYPTLKMRFFGILSRNRLVKTHVESLLSRAR